MGFDVVEGDMEVGDWEAEGSEADEAMSLDGTGLDDG